MMVLCRAVGSAYCEICRRRGSHCTQKPVHIPAEPMVAPTHLSALLKTFLIHPHLSTKQNILLENVNVEDTSIFQFDQIPTI